MPDDELDVEGIYAKRIAGVSVKRIAKIFKTTEATINALLLERTKEVLSTENTRIMVGLESDRLDQFLEALWPKVMEGNEVAIGLSVKIAQRRAVLFGVDAPASHAVTIYQQHQEQPLTSSQQLALGIARAKGENTSAEEIRETWNGDEGEPTATEPNSKARAVIAQLRQKVKAD